MGSNGSGGSPARPSPTVSVVVPTKKAGRTLAACLASLRAQSYPCRVVVVDNASTDATRALAKDGADVFLEAGPERSAQRNCGARSCPADIVGFIDADMVLEPTVVEEAVVAIGGGAGSVIVPERTVGSGFWVQVRAFERSFYQGSDSIEAARFFRWDVFERAGGFDEDLTGPEDWDLAESARLLAPVARTTAFIDHDEGCIGYLEACRKKAYYAEGMRRYVAKRGLSALGQAGQRPWLRQPDKLLNLEGAGLVALKAGEATAMTVTLARAWVTGQLGGTREDRPAAAARLQALRAKWELAVRTVEAVDNWPTVFAFYARAHMPRAGSNQIMEFRFRDGTRLLSLSTPQGYRPVFEVLIGDGYHLAELATLVPEPSHIIDIGAHVGSAALAFARTWPRASITCVEPSPTSAALLRQNVAANCLAASVVQGAAGARTGTGVLCEVVPGSCENKMATVPGERDVHAMSVSVPVVPMVDLLKDGTETAGGTLVKLDCEGSEYELVSATPLRAWESVSAVVMEYHPVPGHGLDELVEHLGEAGFTLVQCEEGNRPGLGQAWFVRPTVKTGHE